MKQKFFQYNKFVPNTKNWNRIEKNQFWNRYVQNRYGENLIYKNIKTKTILQNIHMAAIAKIEENNYKFQFPHHFLGVNQ